MTQLLSLTVAPFQVQVSRAAQSLAVGDAVKVIAGCLPSATGRVGRCVAVKEVLHDPERRRRQRTGVEEACGMPNNWVCCAPQQRSPAAPASPVRDWTHQGNSLPFHAGAHAI